MRFEIYVQYYPRSKYCVLPWLEHQASVAEKMVWTRSGMDVSYIETANLCSGIRARFIISSENFIKFLFLEFQYKS